MMTVRGKNWNRGSINHAFKEPGFTLSIIQTSELKSRLRIRLRLIKIFYPHPKP